MLERVRYIAAIKNGANIMSDVTTVLLSIIPQITSIVHTDMIVTPIAINSLYTRFGGIPQINLSGAIMMRLSGVSRVASSQGIASPVGVNRVLVLVGFFFMVVGVFLSWFLWVCLLEGSTFASVFSSWEPVYGCVSWLIGDVVVCVFVGWVCYDILHKVKVTFTT